MVVEARVTDPDGGVARADANGLLDGIVGGSLDLPVFFDSMHDDGIWPDVEASDAVFGTVGRDGEGSGDPDRMVLRLAAMDPTSTVTLADWPVETP